MLIVAFAREPRVMSMKLSLIWKTTPTIETSTSISSTQKAIIIMQLHVLRKIKSYDKIRKKKRMSRVSIYLSLYTTYEMIIWRQIGTCIHQHVEGKRYRQAEAPYGVF